MRRTGKGFVEAGYLIRTGIGSGMTTAAEKIIEYSKDIVPYDTGTLFSSALVEEPIFLTDQIYVEMGYAMGDDATELINPKTGRPVGSYAIDVHEITETYHHPPTQAKYLEDPFFELVDQTIEYIVIGINEKVE